MARKLYTMEKLPGICIPGEHEHNFKSRTTKSFMLKHIKDKQPNAVASYSAKNNATAKDCLTRQVREAVHLRRSEVLTLNGKTEWHQPALFRIQQEIFRGWKCENYLWMAPICVSVTMWTYINCFWFSFIFCSYVNYANIFNYLCQYWKGRKAKHCLLWFIENTNETLHLHLYFDKCSKKVAKSILNDIPQ